MSTTFNSTQSKKLETLAHVAELYYSRRMDQKAIAVEIHASRSTVSRMLREAVELGMVEVNIKHPYPRDTELEHELMELFRLDEVWVLARDSVDSEEDQAAFGSLGARCVESHLSGKSKLAVCWGHSTRHVIENLRPVVGADVHLIQMIGSMGTSDAVNDGVILTRLGASRLEGTYALLNAPLVVDDAEFARALLQQSAIARVLNEAADADCAMIGLGTLQPESSALYKAGFITDDDLDEAHKAGAVGDVSGNLIDADGQLVESPLSSRIISLSLSQLSGIRHAIGIAYGTEKAPIIRAAALGGCINALVTDREAARGVIATQRAAVAAMN